VLVGGEAVSTELEVVVDPALGGEEALCMARRLEPLHLPFSSSRGLVRHLDRVLDQLGREAETAKGVGPRHLAWAAMADHRRHKACHRLRSWSWVRIPTISAIDSDRNQPPVPIEASRGFR
jgi:hypothetical protein